MSEGAPDETEEQKAERLKQNLIDYSKWKEIQDEEEDEEAKEHRDEEEDARWDAFLESANTWTKDEKDEYIDKIGEPALFADKFKVRQHCIGT